MNDYTGVESDGSIRGVLDADAADVNPQRPNRCTICQQLERPHEDLAHPFTPPAVDVSEAVKHFANGAIEGRRQAVEAFKELPMSSQRTEKGGFQDAYRMGYVDAMLRVHEVIARLEGSDD